VLVDSTIHYTFFATAKAQTIGRWVEAGLCEGIEGSL